jgi:hypothetical protein
MPISGLGGAQPRWSRDGRQIFYVTSDRKLMAVSFDPAKGRAGRPRTVFTRASLRPIFLASSTTLHPMDVFSSTRYRPTVPRR